MKKLVLILTLLLCLVGCGSGVQTKETETETEIKKPPFEIVYMSGNNTVIIDTKTNVMYLRCSSSKGTGVVMLVNEDGTPRLYEGEFE